MDPKNKQRIKICITLVSILVLISLFSSYITANSVPAPHITDAYVDPLKVRPGDTMLITTAVEDDYGITSVTADMGGIELIKLVISPEVSED